MNKREDLQQDTYLVTHTVPAGANGARLDSFLKDRYRRRSRETLKRAIESGGVTIRREQGPHLSVGRLKPSLQLIAGDEVLVMSERKPEPEVCFDYKILYEDEALFVIEKPANLPVHPAGRYFFNTLLVHLRTQAFKNPLKAEREFFLVHRIDKETSGVLVLAKYREAAADLVRQFAERKTEKKYLAVTHGITPEEFTVDAPLRRSLTSKIALKMETAPEGEAGMPSLTFFKRLETAGNFSLVECHPKTGRQHQIRVHLEAAGHPIVGDKLYGRPESEAWQFYERKCLSPETVARLLLPRHALHSAGIRFTHPQTRLPMEFDTGLPEDLRLFFSQQ